MTEALEDQRKFCYGCGREIFFQHRLSHTRLNADGTTHFCDPNEREEHKGSGQKRSKSGNYYSSWNRNNRWYWGYGPGKYHKMNEQRYSSDAYWNSRKKAQEQYNEYRQRYHSTDKISEDKALEILGLTRIIFAMQYEIKIQEIRNAFRMLALRFHPDRRPEGNTETFIKINTAYEFLIGVR